MEKLSYTLESYLDAIYELSNGEKGARLTDVAARMSVKKSTASAAVASLVEKNLIVSARYGNIRLTESGMDRAKLITQKHAIVFGFFTKVLKLDDIKADADACAIEHVISKEAILAMQKLLNN